MKLSIVILFCDKDAMRIDSLLAEIALKVKVENEVVLIDNREKTKDKQCLPFVLPENVKIISQGYNVRQLESRRMAAEVVTGDYVWFVDADDHIMEITDDYINFCNHDVIVWQQDYNEPQKTGTILKSEVSQFMLNTVEYEHWNKWYKADVLKKAAARLEKGFMLSMREDQILVTLILREAADILFANKPVYNYNKEDANAANTNIKDFDAWKSSMFGWNFYDYLLEKYLDKDEFARMDINYSRSQIARHFIRCWKFTENTEIKKQIEKFIMENLSPVEILENSKGIIDDDIGLKKVLKNFDAWFGEDEENKESNKQIVTFSLSRDCNRNCDYCSQKTAWPETNVKLSEDEIFDNFCKCLEKIESIAKKPLYIQLMGGEPTLWSDKLVSLVLERLKDYEEIRIFTNKANPKSLLFKSHKVKYTTHLIDWHGKKLEKIKENELIAIVVTKNDITKLDAFLSINDKQLGKILILPCYSGAKKDNFALDESDFTTIAGILKNHPGSCKAISRLVAAQMCYTQKEICDICKSSIVCAQVDCSTMKAAACCSPSAEWVDIDDFCFDFEPKPDGCSFFY